ncbi:hypothetical protein DV737_g120, partial [Chaetothyriales sp. CBS 132003]
MDTTLAGMDTTPAGIDTTLAGIDSTLAGIVDAWWLANNKLSSINEEWRSRPAGFIGRPGTMDVTTGMFDRTCMMISIKCLVARTQRLRTGSAGVAGDLVDRALCQAFPFVPGVVATTLHMAPACTALHTANVNVYVESRESEQSQGESESGSQFEVSADEARDLRRGLSAWEVHDLERLGYPLYRLIEQFPEVEIFHGRGQVPKERLERPYQTCTVCKKERECLVEQALAASHVDVCNNCQKPVIRHVASFSPPVEPSQCFCHCSCAVELPPACEESAIFLPFIMNLAGATPSPGMLHYLQKHGFCHRNEHAEAVRAAMQTGHDIPSYDEILSNTIAWFIVQTGEQYLDSRLEALTVARTFPNGSPRVSETDSGLPKALEDYILGHVDGNAFGHETRQKWEVEGPCLSKLGHMNVEEVKKWIYVDMLLQEIAMQKQLGMRQEACTRFALWALESAEDFGIGDEDGDSVCSVELFADERTWQEWSRTQCWCSSGGGEENCCERGHERRHVERRLQRLAHRGSYPVQHGMIDWAARRWLTHRHMMREAEADGVQLDLQNLPFWQERWRTSRA